MKKIITDNNNTIYAIGDNLSYSKIEPDVVFLDGVGYGLTGQKVYENVNVPDYVVCDKYKYIDGIFTKNDDYQPSMEEIITSLQQTSNLLLETQADILGGAV